MAMCMVIGSRQRTHGRVLHLFFNDITLQQVSTAKYLGVYIVNQHLTWKCHVEYALQRVRGKLYSINHLCKTFKGALYSYRKSWLNTDCFNYYSHLINK